MKSLRVLAFGLCVLLLAVAASAQDAVKDFSGTWKMDTTKSELGERSRVEAMTMTVTQTTGQLTVERDVERAEGGGMGRGGLGRGGSGGGGKQVYGLDGKETKLDAGGQMGGSIVLKAKSEKGGKLELTATRNMETQMGAMSIKTVETWELSEDGNTLTVSSTSETPRGARNQKMVFARE